MPAKSKAQYKFMQAVASGAVKQKGLSRKEAAEYVKGQDPSKLPHKVKDKEKAGRADIHCTSHEHKACSDRRGQNSKYAKMKWKP